MAEKILHVLVIEDSEDDYELIRLELKRTGFHPNIERVDTESGMRSFLEKKKWDLITSDFQMPNFSAFNALKVRKEYDLDIPLIIISGVINNEEAIALMKAGATDYILKNNLSRLGPAVERELKEAEVRREKNQISKELAASQQQYRIITENMSDMVWIMDLATHKIIYINSAGTNNLGYTLTELKTMPMSHILKPESVNLSRLQIQNSVQDAKPDKNRESSNSFQFEYIRKDKSSFWSEDILEVLMNENNKPVQIMSVGRDITLRKKQEEEVKRSRDYIWTLFENFPALIWRAGLDTKCNYFNKSWLNWTGRTMEQEMGNGWTEGVHLDDLQSCIQTYLSAFKQHKPFQMEYRLRHASGKYRWVVDIGQPFYDLDGKFAGYLGSCYDITEDKQNKEVIIYRATKMGNLYEITCDFNNHQNLDSLFDMICTKTMELLQVPHCGVYSYDKQKDVLILKSVKGAQIPIGTEIPVGVGITGEVLRTRKPIILDEFSTYENRLKSSINAPFSATMTLPMIYGDEISGILAVAEFKPSQRKFSDDDLQWASLLANAAASAIYNEELYQSVQTKADQLAMLYDTGLALNSMLEPKKQLSFLLQIAQQALNCERIAFLNVNKKTGTVTYEIGHGLPQNLEKKITGIEIQAIKGNPIDQLITDHLPVKYSNLSIKTNSELFDPGQKSYLLVPVLHDHTLIGIIAASDHREDKFSLADERLMVLFGNQTAVGIINTRMFAEISSRSKELEALASISAAMRPVQTSGEIIPVILTSLLKLAQAESAVYLKYLPESQEYYVENAVGQNKPEIGTLVSHALARKIKLDSLKPVILDSKYILKSRITENWIKGNNEVALIPMLIEREISGYLCLASDKFFAENIINILTSVADMAANALNRATMHETTIRQLEHLSALRTIDNAITSSTDLTFVLNVLIEQVKDKLRVDAAAILLFDPITNSLEHAASIGFLHKAINKIRLGYGESYAGRAVKDKKLFRVTGIENGQSNVLTDSPFIKDEGFRELICSPLIVKGKLVGVLEVFKRSALNVDDGWLSFLSGIAQQAAIAIDNARLFLDLERSNLNLITAYESTLEGWSRALDLRDRETEGHSKRVVDLTIEISLQMGITSDKLVHIRRGALLHDIGKMGIPDTILLKPGALTPEERLAMEQHPVLADNLLSSIEYLHPASDIPYCHHEKWDGSGYPNGLKGKNIPIQARIFAIVDVFDALTSDRPYRKAWSEKDALEYIAEQSAKHFDPEVVTVFLKLIGERDINN